MRQLAAAIESGGKPPHSKRFTELILGEPRSALPRLIAESKIVSNKVTPYIARIEPSTMSVELLDLSGGTSVNYIGGALVHSNGYLYAVARGVLFKIDPSSFTIVSSASLPLPNENTAYNGMQATTRRPGAGGRRDAACSAAGTAAFRC